MDEDVEDRAKLVPTFSSLCNRYCIGEKDEARDQASIFVKDKEGR